MTKSRTQLIRVPKPAPGMGRFFSPTNLDRYRKLASGVIGESEQHRIFEDLAEEMDAFRCEARVAAVSRPRLFEDGIDIQAGDRI